jgi:hypothetical protein
MRINASLLPYHTKFQHPKLSDLSSALTSEVSVIEGRKLKVHKDTVVCSGIKVISNFTKVCELNWVKGEGQT